MSEDKDKDLPPLPVGYRKYSYRNSSDGFLGIFLPKEVRECLSSEEQERLASELQTKEELGKDEGDGLAEASEVQEPAAKEVSEIFDPAPQKEPVYSMRELGKMREALQLITDRDAINRHKSLLKSLNERSNLRRVDAPLACVTEGTEGYALFQDIKQSCPHFMEAISLIEQALLVAKQLGAAPILPPILIWGPPGVGKTHFAEQLGHALGSGYRRLAFDTDLPNSTLLGSDKRWGNTANGAVFDVLVLGEHANPVLLCDEIDKARRSAGNFGEPLASLHSLLEPVTAKAVTDISLDFKMDASSIIWICTANDPLKVPDTILSRMKVFHISLPTAEQCLLIAQSVARNVLKRLGLSNLKEPPRKFCAVLAHLTAREQSQLLHEAYSRAIVNGRNELRVEDLPQEFQDALVADGYKRAAQANLH